MDAMKFNPLALARPGDSPGVWLGRAGVATLLLLLALAGAMLCWRHLGGKFVQPLTPPVLLVVGILLAAGALLARWSLANCLDLGVPRVALQAVPSVILLGWLLGLSVAGTDPAGLVLFWGLLVGVEGWSWGRFRGEYETDCTQRSGVSPAEMEQPRPLGSTLHAEDVEDLKDLSTTSSGPCGDAELLAEHADFAASVLLEEEPDLRDPAISQQLVRRREESGEVLEGWTRVDFLPAQRVAAAHIAICPPLHAEPVCYAEQQDGSPAQVKVTQATSYGVRLEIKLDEPASEEASVVVEFSIQEQASRARAAG